VNKTILELVRTRTTTWPAKVGMVVRCIHNKGWGHRYTIGKSYTITRVNALRLLSVINDTGDEGETYKARFAPILKALACPVIPETIYRNGVKLNDD